MGSPVHGPFGLDREELLDSVVSAVPMAIIVLLTLLFVAYNPWGWNEPLLLVIVFGLHLVPILTLAPVTYLLVKVVGEASDGRSDTAERVTSWFSTADEGEDDPPTATPGRDATQDDGR